MLRGWWCGLRDSPVLWDLHSGELCLGLLPATGEDGRDDEDELEEEDDADEEVLCTVDEGVVCGGTALNGNVRPD